MELRTVFDLAAIAGGEVYRAPGRIWFPRLQMQFQLVALRRGTYDNNARGRLRQHVLISGPAGWWKSSSTEFFVEQLAGCKDIAEMRGGKIDVPTYLGLGGQGITGARQRGGANSTGDFVRPLIVDPVLLVAPEMMSYLGRDAREMRQRVDGLNEILEEGRITVSQMKMMEEEAEEIDEAAIAKLAEDGIIWNPDRGILRYRTSCSFICCSVPVEPKARKELTDMGFFSRLQVAHYEGKDEEIRKMFINGEGEPGEACELLAEHNRLSWRVVFDQVNSPPPNLMRKLVMAYDKTFRRIEYEMKIRAGELRTARQRGEVGQLLTAIAAARCVREVKLDINEIISLELDHEFHHVPELIIKEEDVEHAIRWIEKNSANIYNDWTARAKLDPSESSDKDLFVAFLETVDPAVMRYDLRDFVKYAMENAGIKKSTAYNRHANIVGRGWAFVGAKGGEYEPLQEMFAIIHPSAFGINPGNEDEIFAAMQESDQVEMREREESRKLIQQWRAAAK